MVAELTELGSLEGAGWSRENKSLFSAMLSRDFRWVVGWRVKYVGKLVSLDSFGGMLSWRLARESKIGSEMWTIDINLGVIRIHKIHTIIINDFNYS